MRHIVLFLSLLLLGKQASAEDIVFMPGPAVYKCSQWTDAKNGSLRTPLAMWIFGFVSGSNLRSVESSSQAKILDNEKALEFVDTYCEDNLDHALSQVAIALVDRFGGQRAKHEWKK